MTVLEHTPPVEDDAPTRLSDVVAALSYALDLVEGQPMGHSVRTCLIGMRLAAEIGLRQFERSALFYALLLKDAGCSSNAARVSALFGADDRAVKRDHKLTYWSRKLDTLKHVARMTRPEASTLGKAGQLARMAPKLGGGEARSIFEIRCERGAEIALMVGLPTDTARAIRTLDEHWDGSGHPEGLKGDAIPLLGRILGLAQTVEVFHGARDESAAFDMARSRSKRWFDPELVRALEATRTDRAFWDSVEEGTGSLGPDVGVAEFEPADRRLVADPSTLDRVAMAFAKVVDAKSPYTYRHSEGVADIAVGVGSVMGFSSEELRDLRRTALLHDVGKLGVSNLILDKQGPLVDAEWDAMKRHPEYTKLILERVPTFVTLAEVAASHHERVDGSGYHRGLAGDELSPAARVLAVADRCEALSADRPYRAALEPDQVRAIMAADSGSAICPDACAALDIYLDDPKKVVTPFRAPSARPAAPRDGVAAEIDEGLRAEDDGHKVGVQQGGATELGAPSR